MADNWAMCGRSNDSATIRGGIQFYGTSEKDIISDSFGMANGLDWTNNRRSSVHKPFLINFAASFIHWSRKIPISDGYHEFL